MINDFIFNPKNLNGVKNTNSVTSYKDFILDLSIFDRNKTKKAQRKEHETYLRTKHVMYFDKTKHEIDEDKMTKRIMKAAEYSGISPVIMSCIVRQESHFKDSIIISKNGKGPMGITSIAIEDMYSRVYLYDKTFDALIKKYKSVDEVYAMKKKCPKMDLGPLGEIFYKYRTKDSLYKAIQKDFDLNLKVGGIIFKGMLNDAKGNIYEAFYNYNGNRKINPKTKHQYRYDYAQSAISNYNNAMNSPVFLMQMS